MNQQYMTDWPRKLVHVPKCSKNEEKLDLSRRKKSLHWACLRGTHTRDLYSFKEPQKVLSVIEKDVGRGGWEEERRR